MLIEKDLSKEQCKQSSSSGIDREIIRVQVFRSRNHLSRNLLFTVFNDAESAERMVSPGLSKSPWGFAPLISDLEGKP